ncbi:MAG: RNA 3'-terminal phosphate cyclase [Candidatus Asgardarchaeia archaeon]
MIEIDGSMGEGGGQILRVAIALATVLNQPVKVYNIRKKRSPPGLKPQHLNAIRALAKISKAKLTGDFVGSEEIMFIPSKLSGGNYKIDIGTAGSISLILQALLPAAVFSEEPTHLKIIGGTDVKWAPPIDYMIHVFSPIIQRMGANIEITLKRRGHYPRGGGIVEVDIQPIDFLRSISIIERGRLIEIKGISHAVRLPAHIAERQALAAVETLKKGGIDVQIDIKKEYYEKGKDPHLGPGSGIVLWAVSENSIIGSDALGEKGVPAEKVGSSAAEKLISEIRTGAGLDKHMADMIIVWAFLATGTSEFTTSQLTLHAKTCLELIKKFDTNAKISISEEGNRVRVKMGGIGYHL